MTARKAKQRGVPAAHRGEWEKIYEETPYQELPWFNPEPSQQIAQAVSDGFLSKGGSILDIGCGAGTNVLFLAREGFQAFGVDLAPAAIRAAVSRASEEGLQADLRVADALDLPFPEAMFAGVTENGCFHTLPVDRRDDYAREVARVLRPGGAFVMAWSAREATGEFGPPHRLSVTEVALVFEEQFQILETRFRPEGEGRRLSSYTARMRRRTEPQPPPR